MVDSPQRYGLGNNWARCAEEVSQDSLESARAGLRAHVGGLKGSSFLDVASGSGLMSAAALSLGASEVLAFDFDPASVSTSEKLLAHFAPQGPWSVRRGDVLNDGFGSWDIVYSWGVLHHTGDVRTALRRAASWVKPGGRYVVAIYAHTPMCRLWTIEKRWHASAPAWQRRLVRWAHYTARVVAWILRDQSNQALAKLWREGDELRCGCR